MLAGLLEPSSGIVEYDGRDIRDDLRRRFAGALATSRKSRISIRFCPAANTCSWSAACARCPRGC